MTTNGNGRDLEQVEHNDDGSADGPTEIEALLPWYEVGTLRRRDRLRVAEALRTDAELGRHADLVREELAEAIRLNETLGAPSARVMDRLMAAIDDEALAARKRDSARVVAGGIAGFIASLSPRTLAFAASMAVLAIALQAFLLVGVLTKPQGPVQVAELNSEPHGSHGTFAMVRFARQASAAEITKFLENYQATLVDGPKAGGVYRVKVAMSSLAKAELQRIVSRMQHEQVVEFAAPSDNE
jgi:anti-sigma-K factor RskA